MTKLKRLPRRRTTVTHVTESLMTRDAPIPDAMTAAQPEGAGSPCGQTILVLGLGNRLLGDDAAGPIVIEQLVQRPWLYLR